MSSDLGPIKFTSVPKSPDVFGGARTLEWVLRDFGKRWTEVDRAIIVRLVREYGINHLYAPPSGQYVTCRRDHAIQFWINKGRVEWWDVDAAGITPPAGSIRDVSTEGSVRHYVPLSTVSHHDSGSRARQTEPSICPNCNMVHAHAQTECD